MNDEIIRGLIGKKVFIKTTSGRNYTGILNAIDRVESPTIFIYLTDKFDKLVVIHSSEIEVIEEVRE